jgi:hypothetical protein
VSGLLLPVGLRERRPERTREPGRRRDNLNGTRVDQAAVWMGRQGWRHEVSAQWTDRRDGSLVCDVLWLDVAHQADQLARAAADRLAGAGELQHGLSGLAGVLGLTLPTH